MAPKLVTLISQINYKLQCFKTNGQRRDLPENACPLEITEITSGKTYISPILLRGPSKEQNDVLVSPPVISVISNGDAFSGGFIAANKSPCRPLP